MRKCSSCESFKEFTEFNKQTKNKSGLQPWCRECSSEASLKRYKEKGAYYDREKQQQKYAANPELYKNKSKKWKNENKEKICLYKKQPHVRIRHNQAKRVKLLLGNGAKTDKLVGCTGKQLKTHLENLFQEGMTWDNYGFYGWHIDHKKSLSSFDLSDPKQASEAFNYKNLQPLWAKDNLTKRKFV